MKAMKLFGISLVSAMSLAGCGGGNGNGAQPTPYNPYVNGQYNQPTAQPYTCQSGMIQLRNAFGQAQCFQTTYLADACAQVGGAIVQGSLCRKERLINGTAKGKFRNNGAMAPDNIPLRVNLFPGEGVKVYGTIDSLTRSSVYWNAQLIQNGAVLGSSSGDTGRSVNLSIASISAANSAQYGQVQPQYNSYPQYNAVPNAQYNYQPTAYPNANGIYNSGFYNQPAMATPTALILQVMFEGKIKVELHASAISCEDGKGNSYPCQ